MFCILKKKNIYSASIMHSKSSKWRRLMINNKADNVIKELFDSLENRYQNNLESIKGNTFVFEYLPLLYCRCLKIDTSCVGSYIYSPGWIKKSDNKSHL